MPDSMKGRELIKKNCEDEMGKEKKPENIRNVTVNTQTEVHVEQLSAGETDPSAICVR